MRELRHIPVPRRDLSDSHARHPRSRVKPGTQSPRAPDLIRGLTPSFTQMTLDTLRDGRT